MLRGLYFGEKRSTLRSQLKNCQRRSYTEGLSKSLIFRCIWRLCLNVFPRHNVILAFCSLPKDVSKVWVHTSKLSFFPFLTPSRANSIKAAMQNDLEDTIKMACLQIDDRKCAVAHLKHLFLKTLSFIWRRAQFQIRITGFNNLISSPVKEAGVNERHCQSVTHI